MVHVLKLLKQIRRNKKEIQGLQGLWYEEPSHGFDTFLDAAVDEVRSARHFQLDSEMNLQEDEIAFILEQAKELARDNLLVTPFTANISTGFTMEFTPRDGYFPLRQAGLDRVITDYVGTWSMMEDNTAVGKVWLNHPEGTAVWELLPAVIEIDLTTLEWTTKLLKGVDFKKKGLLDTLVSACVKLFIITTVLLLTKGVVQETKSNIRLKRPMQESKVPRNYTEWNVISIGSTGERTNHGGTHRSPRMHKRRRHWRNQRYGPGNELHRPIVIPEIWINKSWGSPTKHTLYKIKPKEG